MLKRAIALTVLLLAVSAVPAAAGLKPRVAGGYYPHPQVVPAVTSIQSSAGGACTAVLIAPKRVLTAAHCVQDDLNPASWTARVGVRDRADPNQGETRRVTGIIMHPQVSLPTRGIHAHHAFYDVAVMFLDRAVSAPPVPLGNPEDFGAYGTAMGWGHTNYDHDRPVYGSQLKAIDLKLGSDELCGRYANGADGTQHYFPAIHICAYDQPGVNCITHGDSGGPLMVQAGGEWRLIGITSFFPQQYSQGPCANVAMTGFAWVSGPTLRDWPYAVGNPGCDSATASYNAAYSNRRRTRKAKRRLKRAANAYNAACTGI